MKRRLVIAAAAILGLAAASIIVFQKTPFTPRDPSRTTDDPSMTTPPDSPRSPTTKLRAPPIQPARQLRRSETANFPSRAADRVAAARKRSDASVREMFTAAGVSYPAGEVFLRGFKREGELELWAAGAGESFRLVTTYDIASLSGGPGPKRREGDGQVPEGFYEVDRFNPLSSFHLSLGINYPNAADRILGDPQMPGTDIFIHGSNVSIGCLAMGDDRIEELYLAALDSTARPIRVHLFPARMDAPDWPQWRDEMLAQKPGCAPLWEHLGEGFALFEKTKRIPGVSILPDGSYRIAK